MGKTNSDRFDGALEFITKYFPNAAKLLEQRINALLGGQRSAIASALSLGGRDDGNSPAETERRNGSGRYCFFCSRKALTFVNSARFVQLENPHRGAGGGIDDFGSEAPAPGVEGAAAARDHGDILHAVDGVGGG